MQNGTIVTLLIFTVLLSIRMEGSQAVAQTPKAEHPVVSHSITERNPEKLAEQLATIMAMGEEELLALVPIQTPTFFCGCPNCKTGRYDGEFDMEWAPEEPYQMRCKHCGHIYPDEENYPMDRTQTATNPLGEEVTIHYHVSGGHDYFLQSKIWHFQKEWLRSQTYELAKAYHVTRKPEYARRAALILDRFAQVFPGWCVMVQYSGGDREYTSLPYHYLPPDECKSKYNLTYPTHTGGKWHDHWMHEVPSTLALAYDLIYDSPELDRLSEELGVDVRKRIENDFLRLPVDFCLETIPEEWYGDNRPRWVVHIINIGRIIGDPEYVHFGYHWLKDMFNGKHVGIYPDGMSFQPFSYHYQTFSNCRLHIAALRGHSDPPGYVGKQDGLHLAALDMTKEIPNYAKVTSAPAVVDYPGRNTVSLGDAFRGSRPINPEEESSCAILPAFGHARLGAGKGENQVQAHLRFTGGGGHMHPDSLSMALYAFGREMLCDVGYHKNSGYRFWGFCTMGHNTVAIDRKWQAYPGADCCDLQTYIPNLPGLAAFQASAEHSYPDLAQVYERLLLLVTTDEEHPYVVDVFQVRGGSMHDWFMHGSADHDQTATSSLPLTKLPGDRPMLAPDEEWRETSDEQIWNSPTSWRAALKPYGVLRNVETAESADDWAVTFTYDDEPKLGTRIHLLSGQDRELFLCESPSLRRFEGPTNQAASMPYMPQIVARRTGQAPLESVFIAVTEPFCDGPHISAVERLQTVPADENRVALQIRAGNRTDTVLIALDGAAGVRTAGSDVAVLDGRFGLISEVDGNVVAAYLVGGKELTKGSFSLTAQTAVYEGEIEAATRIEDGAETNAFITSAPRPPGMKLRGAWMLVTHGDGRTHGYQIEQVENRAGQTWIQLTDDHGLRINGDTTQEVYRPNRTFKGPNRFRIYATAMTRAADR